jgi:hypothetical protein
MNTHVLGNIAWAPPLLPGIEPKYLDGLKANVSTLVEIRDRAITRVKTIADSKELTATGKRSRLDSLASEIEAELQAAVKEVRYGRLIDQTESSMKPSKPTIDAVMQSRHAEIRAHLAGLSDIERDAAYRAAVLEGDAELIEAVETAPRVFRLVDPKTIAEMRDQRLAVAFPKEFETLQMWRTLAASLRDAVQAVRASLYDAGIPRPESKRNAA